MRELVALEGGPRDHFWYWSTDWETVRESARAWHLRDDQPLPDVLCYEPTTRRIDNPNPQYGQGQVWRYRSPVTDEDAAPVFVLLASGVPAVLCPRCARPAPELITFPAAPGDRPAKECPRCAYPDQRYLGDRVETMPDTYLEWYEAHEHEAVTTADNAPTASDDGWKDMALALTNKFGQLVTWCRVFGVGQPCSQPCDDCRMSAAQLQRIKRHGGHINEMGEQ